MRPQCCECVGALDRSPRSRGWTCIRARVLRRRGAQISDLPISPLSVLPSTRITVSALRTGISALDSPARMPRYRRFTDRLATACARLAVRHGRPALCQRDFHPRPYSSLPGCSTLYDLSSPIWMGMEKGVQGKRKGKRLTPTPAPGCGRSTVGIPAFGPRRHAFGRRDLADPAIPRALLRPPPCHG